MIKYSITMGIRVVCIVLMLFVQGWWLLVCALGAILLPYIAVVIANVHSDPRGATVYRPGAIELVRRDDVAGADGAQDAPGAAPDAPAPGDPTEANPGDRRDTNGSAA